jgi:ADP-ribose pyrophosphatase YjhB (NUDIX family)
MCERQRCRQQWTENSLRERLRLFHTTAYSWSNLSASRLNDFTKAAVLVPLVVCDGQVEIWLTERSQHVRSDRGDVAFPGGKKDDGDIDAVETSLREAEEEIGLKKHQVTWLGLHSLGNAKQLNYMSHIC